MATAGNDQLTLRVGGVLMVACGVAALVFLVPGESGVTPKLVRFGAVTGPTLIWFGAGLVAVPLLSAQLRGLEGGDLGRWFRALPGFWKAWAPLTLVVLFAALIRYGLATT